MQPSALDLIDVEQVKEWLRTNKNPTGDADDDNIQLCITAVSSWWLGMTGLGNMNSVNTASPLNSIVFYNETYNGNGSAQFFTRNSPIYASATIGSTPYSLAITINGVTVPQSTTFQQPGWVIDGDARSIWIRHGGGAGSGQYQTFGYPYGGQGGYFAKGIQNVNIQYPAGYAVTPLDIQLAVIQQVAMNYKRKDWIDQASKSMANGAGTTSYRSWKIPPEAQWTLTKYQRVAMY